MQLQRRAAAGFTPVLLQRMDRHRQLGQFRHELLLRQQQPPSRSA